MLQCKHVCTVLSKVGRLCNVRASDVWKFKRTALICGQITICTETLPEAIHDPDHIRVSVLEYFFGKIFGKSVKNFVKKHKVIFKRLQTVLMILLGEKEKPFDNFSNHFGHFLCI